MKRFELVLTIILIILLMAAPSFAGRDRGCSASATGSTSGTLYTGSGYATSLQVTPTASDVTVILFEASAAGREVGRWTAKGSANPESTGRPFENFRWFEGNLFYTSTVAGAHIDVGYIQSDGKCDY